MIYICNTNDAKGKALVSVRLSLFATVFAFGKPNTARTWTGRRLVTSNTN